MTALDSPPTALVLDDDPLFRPALGALLTASGYRVREVSTIREARQALDGVVDVALFDQLLPDGDGIAFGLEVKAASADYLPVVILSGADPRTTRARTFHAQLDEFFEKPGDVDVLLNRLQSLVALRLAQRRLRRADSARQQFVRFLLHDFSNALQVAQDSLHDLGRCGDAHLVADCHLALARVQRLAQRALDTELLEEEALVLRPQSVSPRELLERIAQTFRAPARARGAQVVVSAESTLAPFRTDPWVLGRILENLVDNATHHVAAGGTIRLAARRIDADAEALLEAEIANDGPPPPAWVEALLRDESVPPDAPVRHGIGLRFCSRAAHRLGGTLTARSDERGPVLTLRVPQLQPTS